MTETDPKKLMGSQQFIGILKEEYLQRNLQSQKGEMINQAFIPKRSLHNRITSKPSTNANMHCKHCGFNNHNTIDCKHLGKSKCSGCGRFGHTSDQCYNKGKDKRKRAENDGQGNGRFKKKWKKEEINQGEKEVDEEEIITLNVEEVNPQEKSTSPFFEPGEEGQHYNFNSDGTYNMHEINEPVIYYDWFGDSATSSHVANGRDIFTTYQPLHNTSVVGVGRLKAKAEGKGTIELESRYNNKTYVLRLENVLHIPTNRNNLLSLGKWDSAGGRYIGGGGKIILEDKNGTAVAAGTKIENNLYKLKLNTRSPRVNSSNQEKKNLQSFSMEETQNWETWHKCYGHIGYSGIQKLIDHKMVDGLTIDISSIKPDCEICIQAKQTIKPFDGKSRRNTKAGELTHIDLWGKYEIASIHGNQYYILFIDDATRYVTVHFLKRKDEAAKQVKEYLTYLKTQEKFPKAIRIDRGSEFLNQNLKPWFNENGLEIQTTAPYSPSQNGVAERMNRTLVELGCAMIKGQNLPEFLWEYAIAHAAYLRNRAYTKFLKDKTPYQEWFKSKPNVNHLREFGAPVWVMLQGQKIPRKMLPKSQKRVYVGYEDGSKSIKYYIADKRKILTSRNYRFLSTTNSSPPEEIVVAPDLPHEGEMEEGMLPIGSNSQKRKRVDEEEPMSSKRAKRVDYQYLNDPFTDDDEEDQQIKNSINLHNRGTDDTAYVNNDGLNSFTGDPWEEDIFSGLEEAKKSPEWAEWEKAVKTELDQLHKTGTWILVDEPKEAIPISNKWVFEKK